MGAHVWNFDARAGTDHAARTAFKGWRGEREHVFFDSAPAAVEIFDYQCSPLSTQGAIIRTFELARASHLGNHGTGGCVLLHDVGLAEGLAFTAIVVGLVVLAFQFNDYGYLPNAIPVEGGRCD